MAALLVMVRVLHPDANVCTRSHTLDKPGQRRRWQTRERCFCLLPNLPGCCHDLRPENFAKRLAPGLWFYVPCPCRHGKVRAHKHRYNAWWWKLQINLKKKTKTCLGFKTKSPSKISTVQSPSYPLSSLAYSSALVQLSAKYKPSPNIEPAVLPAKLSLKSSWAIARPFRTCVPCQR